MTNCPLLPPHKLVTPRRWDLAVKWRFFRHLQLTNDPDSTRVYGWHLLARRAANAKLDIGMDSKKAALDLEDREYVDRYIQTAHGLLVSMKANGFVPRFAIPIDPNGELLGGAHRVACALALELAEIPVENHTRYAWAPEWGDAWFAANGMDIQNLMRVEHDWQTIKGIA